MIKAIETRYAGCHFRSRLEARWAVFFDTLGIPWEYEPQGFNSEWGGPYLPDFEIFDTERGERRHLAYVEVKGSDEQLRNDSKKLGGSIDYNATPIADGLLILGPIPRATTTITAYVTHTFAYWRKGVEVEQRYFGRRSYRPHEGWSLIPLRNHPAEYFCGNTSETLPDDATVEAMVWQPVQFKHGSTARHFPGPAEKAQVFMAYDAARSARFEHGQSGAT